jgi:hypothetical protein
LGAGDAEIPYLMYIAQRIAYWPRNSLLSSVEPTPQTVEPTPAVNPPDAQKLLESANSASEQVGVLHLGFIAASAYVIVIAVGRTDLDLLIGKGIRLPVIDTEVPYGSVLYLRSGAAFQYRQPCFFLLTISNSSERFENKNCQNLLIHYGLHLGLYPPELPESIHMSLTLPSHH